MHINAIWDGSHIFQLGLNLNKPRCQWYYEAIRSTLAADVVRAVEYVLGYSPLHSTNQTPAWALKLIAWTVPSLHWPRTASFLSQYISLARLV